MNFLSCTFLFCTALSFEVAWSLQITLNVLVGICLPVIAEILALALSLQVIWKVLLGIVLVAILFNCVPTVPVLAVTVNDLLAIVVEDIVLI